MFECYLNCKWNGFRKEFVWVVLNLNLVWIDLYLNWNWLHVWIEYGLEFDWISTRFEMNKSWLAFGPDLLSLWSWIGLNIGRIGVNHICFFFVDSRWDFWRSWKFLREWNSSVYLFSSIHVNCYYRSKPNNCINLMSKKSRGGECSIYNAVVK